MVIRPSKLVKVTDGTNLTELKATELSKPLLVIYLSDDKEENIDSIAQWILKNDIKRLNIAGPRESQSIGIYESSCKFLEELFNHNLAKQNSASPQT